MYTVIGILLVWCRLTSTRVKVVVSRKVQLQRQLLGPHGGLDLTHL